MGPQPGFFYYVGKLVKEGYKNVYNMTEGFEGVFGDSPYRRVTDGWQHAGLPYQYIDKIGDLDPKYVYPGAMVIK